MFGAEVCRVLLTGDFSQLDLACADGLLDPQSLGIEVAKLTQTLARADPHRRTRVGPYPKGYYDSQVTQQCLVSKALPGASDHPVELSLP